MFLYLLHYVFRICFEFIINVIIYKLMQMSLSGKTDNDPNNPYFGTLAKRILPSSVAFVDSSRDIDSAQLSSTKGVKTL